MSTSGVTERNTYICANCAIPQSDLIEEGFRLAFIRPRTSEIRSELFLIRNVLASCANGCGEKGGWS